MRYKVKQYDSYEFENSELPHNFDLVCQFQLFCHNYDFLCHNYDISINLIIMNYQSGKRKVAEMSAIF